MTNSTYSKINNYIESSAKGTLFFPEDFAEFGSSDGIRSALVRLCENGQIVRISQGVYCRPEEDDKLGLGAIIPSVEEVAKEIARRDRVRILPIGDYALNALGLSTQVPANVVYITDGSPRRINIGKGRGILFRHTSEMRNFDYYSDLMMLIVTSLREIGEGKVTQSELEIIAKHLLNVTEEDFKHDINLAPVWVRKVLTAIKTN